MIQGASNFCGRNYAIRELDGSYDGTRLEVLPGSHAMKVSYRSSPYIGDDPRTPFFPQCVRAGVFETTFSVLSGHRYWFHVDESSADASQLTVWESIGPRNPAGRQIAAESRRLSLRQECYIDERFNDCF